METFLEGALSIVGYIPLDGERKTYAIESWNEVEAVQLLPRRVRATELRGDGGISLIEYADERANDLSTNAWIPGGLYRSYDERGRLYFLQIRGVVRGRSVTAYYHRPRFRVKAGRRIS